MSTECKFSFIIVKEFLHQCNVNQGKEGVGRFIIMGKIIIVNVVKERTLSQKSRFNAKFSFGAEHVL